MLSGLSLHCFIPIKTVHACHKNKHSGTVKHRRKSTQRCIYKNVKIGFAGQTVSSVCKL